jgi:hypothetical protein
MIFFPGFSGFHRGFRSSAMPHFGHAAGLSDSTPGHIGQMYLAAEGAGVTLGSTE